MRAALWEKLSGQPGWDSANNEMNNAGDDDIIRLYKQYFNGLRLKAFEVTDEAPTVGPTINGKFDNSGSDNLGSGGDDGGGATNGGSDGIVSDPAPNRTVTPVSNANDTFLGRVNGFFASVGGQTADNYLNTATTAALGAQEGLRDHVGLSGDFALNLLPIPRGSSQFGPFPGGIGWGGSADANFRQGLTGDQGITGGKFGASGSLGISFDLPFSGPGSGRNNAGEITLSGGAGPGGAIKVGIDRDGNVTGVKIVIGVGFGFEVGAMGSVLGGR